MLSSYKKLFYPVSPQNKQEFSLKKFTHNNKFILVLSVFLTVEQLYYGLFVEAINSLTRKMYFFTTIIMLIYVLISSYIRMKKPIRISLIHKIYEISFGALGFLIAITRGLIVQNDVFSLPAIYIAVVYGFSVIFYFNPYKSFFMYAVNSVALMILLPLYQPDIAHSSYIEDIVSNNTIAWIASIINYYKYVKVFIGQEIISKNNQQLKQKTLQIKKMNEKLKEMSIKDELTNMYNRRKLNEILQSEHSNAKKYGRSFSVILIDIDMFKSINDTYGHNVGDKVLTEMSEVLKNNIRNSDIVGRWGGEEFLVVCTQTNMQQTLDIANKLKLAIENYTFPVVNKSTASFGVATYQNEGTVEDLINRADKGLYQAKDNGRNRIEVIV